jgi:hypothetical protein
VDDEALKLFAFKVLGRIGLGHHRHERVPADVSELDKVGRFGASFYVRMSDRFAIAGDNVEKPSVTAIDEM